MTDKPLCVHCDKAIATLSCSKCDGDFFCNACFDSQHCSGSRLKHFKTIFARFLSDEEAPFKYYNDALPSNTV